MQKAFDKVPHKFLLESLRDDYHLPPTLINWLHSYLSGRSQFVTVDASRSASVSVPSGVPQGSILGPTLFISLIDPLLVKFRSAFPELHLQAYADDLCLLIPMKLLSDLPRLGQPAVDFVGNLINSIGLSFNIPKSQLILFHYNHCKLGVLPTLTLQNQRLEYADSIKYLGITLSSDMKFTEHVTLISARARRMIGALRRKLGHHVDRSIFKTVFTVVPSWITAFVPMTPY